MKIPLRDQIAYMERHRDKGLSLAAEKPELMSSVHIAEGVLLTLEVYRVYESEIERQSAQKEMR